MKNIKVTFTADVPDETSQDSLTNWLGTGLAKDMSSENVNVESYDEAEQEAPVAEAEAVETAKEL